MAPVLALPFSGRVHIHSCDNGGLGFRPYGGSLLVDPRVGARLAREAVYLMYRGVRIAGKPRSYKIGFIA